jgi:hypothetical protein
MKKLIIFILAAIFISSCRKDLGGVLPAEKQNTLSTTQRDSIPDSACFKIQILKDSTMIDETAVAFFRSAPVTYNGQMDSEYFAGFGIASLATLTSDGVPCAIQCIPFRQANAVRLKIGSGASSNYILKLSYLHKFPSGVHIWLRDKFLKDSLDLRNKNYAFTVNKPDTSTFGSGRFQVVVR